MRASVRVVLLALLAILIAIPPIRNSLETRTSIYSAVDCYITNWEPNTSYAGSIILKVSREVEGNRTLESRAIIGFDLSDLHIPPFSKVINATLVLTAQNFSQGISIEVWDLKGEPDLFHTSWLYESDGNPWNNPGGDIIEKWGEVIVDSSRIEINLTDYVQSYVNGELKSKGWILLKLADDQHGQLDLYSENANGKGPRIMIDYEPASLDLSLESSSIELMQGRSTSLEFYVGGSLSKPVNLSLEAPNFLNYVISPSSGVPPFKGILNISLPEDAPGGKYVIIIKAEGALQSSLPFNLTVIERRGFIIEGRNSVELKGGFIKKTMIRVLGTGNYSGEVSAGVSGSPDWLNISISPSKGMPPFNLTVTLQSDPGVNATGIVSLIFNGEMNKVFRFNVTTLSRRVAIYSNGIDWNLSKEALIDAANLSGVTLSRINSSREFPSYDIVLILGGHKAPTDEYMPVNMAGKVLSEREKEKLESGGTVIHVEREGETYIVVVAGADRYKTSHLLTSSMGNGRSLAYMLITGDPNGVRGAG